MSMYRLCLIHWNAAEAEERVHLLRSAGYEVAYEPLDAAVLRRLRADPPDAVVIDLSRLPSHGRDVGLAVRMSKATRHVPLVFVAGAAEKVARVKEQLPDAVYATWSQIGDALPHAIDHPPAEPVAPRSLFDGYSGTPLPKKLGIKPNSAVALVDAPVGFEDTLGELPEGAVHRRQAGAPADVTLWFIRSREDLESRIEEMGAFAERGGLWIIWPKKSSGIVSDLSQTAVREAGLASGLVDYKVCAVDATWSGLRFTRRKG
jgi:CheY-like chemotaxis protein